ncbi:hypothetical protein Pmani_028707 [Petrolisthes manimaculis]|uniref:Uncharacterized protein n=1 Tax=Petrolisthes manimaculis TaxID=1843537 RepID=A0AAE1TXT0_9EUCA|nr:hypothetical protein Pmani_028707 [Petrolisthes manimaculis]
MFMVCPTILSILNIEQLFTRDNWLKENPCRVEEEKEDMFAAIRKYTYENPGCRIELETCGDGYTAVLVTDFMLGTPTASLLMEKTQSGGHSKPSGLILQSTFASSTSFNRHGSGCVMHHMALKRSSVPAS